MVHKTKKNSRLSSFSFWGPCYQNQTVNKGSHAYFETSLAPQSKTFPAIIPSMREICRCSHGSASNSLSLLESRRSAASFSSCFTCKLKGRKNKRVTSQKKGGKQALVQIGRKYTTSDQHGGKKRASRRKTCFVKIGGKTNVSGRRKKRETNARLLYRFRSSFESKPRLHRFCFLSLCYWSKKLAPLSQPIKCKTKTNHDLVIRVFPRFGKFVWFNFEFSLVLRSILLSFD